MGKYRGTSAFSAVNTSTRMAFLRVAFKLGVLDAERREFWRFFIRAARTHHDRMVELLRHAAMAYHFRKLNESYGDT